MTDQPAAPQLTHRQRLFVEEYIRTWHQTNAARAAGYKWPERAGWLTLQRPAVKAAIEARIKQAALGADEVLARLSQQATTNMADFVSVETLENGDQVVKLDWNEIKRRGYLVKKIGNTPNGPMIELVDGQNALITLGKHLKLFVERTELTGKDGGPIETEDVGLTDEERAERINAILDKARERRAGQTADSESTLAT